MAKYQEKLATSLQALKNDQEQLDHYMSALETASVEGDILPFARFIARLLPNV